MSYIEKLSTAQKNNLDIIIKAFDEWGITNDFTRAAILAIISKESMFKCDFERGYGNTSNDRIRKIFGFRASRLSDAELTAIKKDDFKFFNLVYGGRYGNGPTQGWMYRGAGFNQITFKGNYSSAAKRTGVDLINQPQMIENPNVAAAAAITYFIDRFKRGFSTAHQRHYKSNGINDFGDLNNATLAIYHANAGFGKAMYTMSKVNESTGGLKKAINRAPEFLAYVTGRIIVPMPFKTKSEGDKFRNWVNDNHPGYAKQIQLDRSGSHTNAYIEKAWNKFSDEYLK